MSLGGILAAASMILIAASFSAMNTGAIAFIGDVAPIDRESELHGLRSTVMGVGSAIGPILVGAMATIFSYEISFVIISLATFTGMIIANLKVTESRETNG